MGRIASNLTGIERTLLNRLADSNAQITLANLRLALGARITAPRDDPAGFVTVAGLSQQLGTVTTTMANVTAASTLVSGTQSLLDQVRSQLDLIRQEALADADGSLSADERAAHQAAIDQALTKIGQLVQTRVGNRKVLDGSADFQKSGWNRTQIRSLEVYSRGPGGTDRISGTVTAAATQAHLTRTEGTGLVTANAKFTLGGNRGESSVSVTAGESLSTVASRINAVSHETGVTAAVSGGTQLVLSSIDYGSQQQVSVAVTQGTFTVTGGDGAGLAQGTDAAATIDGQVLTGRGNRFAVSQNGFRFSLEFAGGFSGAFSSITVSGTALRFALTPESDQVSTLAISGLEPELLGGLSGSLSDLASGGAYSGLGSNTARAVRIVDEALGQLSRTEGLVDGFATSAVDASQDLLDGWQTQLSAALVRSDGVSEAQEQATIAHYQALGSNALSGLALLNQQRQNIIDLVRQIAGLS